MHHFDISFKKALSILNNIKATVLLVCVFSIISAATSAQNFTVTSNGDTHAVTPTASALDAGAQITLRSAMEASTQIAGTHTITIPGSITTINLTLGQITVGSAAVGNNITLNGPGKAVLTINQTTVARIFITGTGAITFNINDLTMNYTGPVGTILSGGGGCVQAGGINAVTTMTNVAINNFNIQVGNGGAFLSSAANVNGVTLTNCDFNNNFCGGGGGAVNIQTTSTATITNCKFINNSTGNISGSAGTNTGGSGGALSVTGNGGTHNVTNCTFVNNHQTTAAQGGAIMLSNGTLNVSFCRFIGNTANIPTNGNTLAVAGGNSQVINADNNWWGTNSGPAANDAVVLAAGATINLVKWLQLKTSINTNPLCTGGSATVTASFLANSNAEAVTNANVSTLIGQPISFVNPTLGSLSGAQATIQNNGAATVTFTAGGTAGTGSVNAVVDNVPNNDVAPAKISFTINPGAAVTGNPSNTTVCAGANASFTASFSGTPTPTIQWQVSTNGGGIYNNIAGATSSPLTFATVAGNNGNLYRAVGTNTCGSVNTTGALLTVNTAPAVTGNPSNQSVPAGSNASFTASFSGSPTPTLQWQVSTNGGGTYNNIAGATSSPLVFVTNLSQSGNLYRAVGTNLCSSANTTGALLTVTNACATSSVISVSGATTICTGSQGNIKVTITGGASPFTVVYNDGTNNFSVPGYTSGSNIALSPATTKTYTLVSVTDANSCVGSGNSGSATINVNQNNTINLSSLAGTDAQTVTVNTAIANITYATTGATGATVTGLPSGVNGVWAADVVTISGTPSITGTFNYTVTLTGGCGSITANGSIQVNTACAVTGSATPTNPACFGGTGSASVTLSGTGAGAPGTYTVDAGSPVAYNSNPFTVPNLAAGNHTIVATVSAGGCVSSLIGVSITAPAQLSGSGVTTPTTCGNPNNGTATITLLASTSGTYTLDAGAPVPYNSNPFMITGLTAGNHTVVATSAAGCVSSAIPINVGSSATFTATYTKTNLSACNVVPDGSITVTPSGGTGPYSYAWTGITGSGNPATTQYPNPGNVSSITGLNYGYYNVTITDQGGCGSVTFTNIHVEFAFNVYITNNGSNSSGCGNTGSIVLYGNAGIQPYSYSLDGTNYQPSNTFTGLAAGPYTAYIKDAGGCISTKPITVSAAAAIVVSPFVRNASSCSNDGAIEIYRSGGIPPYSYSLDGINYQAGNVYSNLAAGPYTAYVKDSKGCVGSQAVNVGQGSGLTVVLSKVNTSTCTNDGSIQATASGGQAPYTYSINGGVTYQAGNAFSGLGAGNYTITVKDFKNCTGTASTNIALNPIVVTGFATAASSCVSTNGSVQLYRSGGYGPFTYSLDGNIYQSSSLFSGKAHGTYTGYVKDSKGCVGSVDNIVVGPTDCPPPLFARTNVKVNTTSVPVNDMLTAKAYPNPSTTEFVLVLEGYSNAKITITVTDIMGRKVYSIEGNPKKEYHFGNDLKAGIYMVRVEQGDKKQNIKLVKE